jgi:hypothetical protein
LLHIWLVSVAEFRRAEMGKSKTDAEMAFMHIARLVRR